MLDVAIDGADEVDDALNCIKGGGACQTQEKLVAAAANGAFIIIADDRKALPPGALLGTGTSAWTGGVPIEVLPCAYVYVGERLRALGCNPVLRMGGGAKAGPCVTDNGGFVLDCHWPGGVVDPVSLHDAVKALPGVLETGLFCGPLRAAKAYFGLVDGVREHTPETVCTPSAGVA